MTGRTPSRIDGAFDIEWHHLAEVVTHKTIKDMLIRDYIQAVGSEKAKNISLGEI